MIASGMHYSWTSPSLPKLQSNTSTIFVSNEQGSWMAVMPLLGSFLGGPIVAVVVDFLGRKKTFILGSIPYFAAWIMVAYAQSVAVIHIARFMAGAADGFICTAAPMYIGEISSPKIRGLLGSGISVAHALGFLLINIVGSYLSIRNAALVSSAIPLLAILIFLLMPESPYYFVMRNNLQLAKKNLQRLRGTNDVEEEFTRISLAVKQQTENSGKFLDLFTNKVNRKAVYIMLILRGAQQLSGTAAMTFYTQQIFIEAGSNLSSDLASIIYFSVQLSLSCFCSSIVDKTGRRPLLLVSILGSAAALIVQGTYFYLKTQIDVSGLTFIPIVALIGFVVTFSLGLQTIPVVILGEIFSANVKAFALCLADIYFSIIATVVSKFFQIMTDAFGIYVPFYAFTGSCVLGAVLIYFFVPETKGKTLEDIQRHFRGNDDGTEKKKVTT
ncbi:facilitated trehalose transporter Tret1-like [Cylas formicarius]|uniref:facilitated trehalose transporter Tret1-like n=1 Tax=Cylas formicarius TaxID=197179 RepID=UPI0029583915|nr:facilitated trehalose transporter Tret1-like [Cylas formicarius]